MGFNFKAWYQVNGKRLNETRKTRYHTDPEYRKRVLETNQRSREQRKENAPEEKKVRAHDNFKTMELEVDGKKQKMFTIGAAAKALGCSIQAIRNWERRGILPKTPHRTPKTKKSSTGDRLYTFDMLETYRTILTKQGRIGGKKPSPKTTTKAVVFKGRVRPKSVEMFTIGQLAERVGKSASTLEQLESKGILPETPFRVSSVGRRLYTTEMVDAVEAALANKGGSPRGDAEWAEVKEEIFRAWTNLRVFGARIYEDGVQQVGV